MDQEDTFVKNVFNKNTSYSFKEALVHKLCSISSLFPKTYNVEINGMNLTIEMEKLQDQLKDKSPQNKEKSWLRILQAVALLNYFGIAHRDIKSENVMYRREESETGLKEEAVLIDFGLSKVLYGDCHTPDVISQYYRPPELNLDLEEQKYGMEVDSWAMGIWALELYNKKFNPVNFLEQWQQGNYLYYLDKVPVSIRPIVESFLLPADKRKVALDWVEIEKDVKLFHYPEDYDICVPEKAKKWEKGYKAIRWNLDEYNYTNEEKAVIAVWMTSQLFMPYPIPLKQLCKPFKLDDQKVYKLALEWFVNFKLA